MSTYSSAALTNTRLTRVFNRRNNMAKNVDFFLFPLFFFFFLKTAMIAPSQRISTTVYLHAQFVAPHTSRRVWHFIIAKLRKRKYSVIFLSFFLRKRSRGSNTVLEVDTIEEYIVNEKVKIRPQSPPASDTVEVLLLSDTPAVIAAAANTQKTQ